MVREAALRNAELAWAIVSLRRDQLEDWSQTCCQEPSIVEIPGPNTMGSLILTSGCPVSFKHLIFPSASSHRE